MKRSIAILLLIVLTACILVACNSDDSGYITLTGRFLKSDISNTVYIITDDNSPIEMDNQSEDKELFDGLYNGDRIKIKCGLIRETYPGSTDVYACEFIETGSIDDISSDVLESLREFGRIS